MKLSQTEILTIFEIGNGNNDPQDISRLLKISLSQAYRIIAKLKEKGIISESVELEKKTYINSLFKLLLKSRYLATVLSGTGIQIFSKMINLKTANEIQIETKLHITTIFKKIRQARKISLIVSKNKKYCINEKIWPEIKEFLIEMNNHEKLLDTRIPVSSIIYSKKDNELLFSNRIVIDAKKTAFCAYEDYGIKIYNTTNYYFLPKRELTLKEVFLHSLIIAEKDHGIRNRIFLALFYLKHKKTFRSIRHPILDDIKQVLSGRKISGYPSISEIKEKAALYGIQVSA